jgi:Family of unknown function (DUF6221)
VTDDIVAFIRARLDERQDADWHERTCQPHRTMPPGTPLGLAGSPMSCNCGVPDEVGRSVEAKRRIVDAHELEVFKVDAAPFDSYTGEPRPDEYDVICSTCGWATSDPSSGCLTVRLLASERPDHPDYRKQWTP